MPQQVLTLDPRGLAHCQAVLDRYLPGLDPGLTPLAPREALLAGSTLLALQRAYGANGREAVLHEAGVTAHAAVTDQQALDKMAQRNLATLPARAAVAGVPRLWHLDAANVRSAWQHWGGPDNIAWGNVKVGQIDTGYTRHPVFGFGAQPWVDVAAGRTFFAVGGDGGGPGPGDGVDPVQTMMDGHGTRVGSVICGDDRAAPGGAYLGVAPRVPLVPVRIANVVLISHAQRELAQAIRYLVRDARVAVINLSMGFLPRLQMAVLDRAIDEAYEAGVILVCAAGQPLPSVVSPAHGRRTVAAAGSTPAGIPWGKSAFGGAVDWTAPATEILRAQTSNSGSPSYAGGGDGTSYAAALTSGAAALWVSRHGAALDAAYPQGWQRVEAFKAVAKATARPMPNQQPGSFGAGILDIGALVQAPLPPKDGLSKERPA